MTTDFPDWMPASQSMLEAYAGVTGELAALIATGTTTGAPGGVPLLGMPTEEYNLSAVVLTANTANQVLSNVSAGAVTAIGNYLSFDIHGRFAGVGGEPSPFVVLSMKWYQDAAATVQVWEDDWIIPLAVGAVGFLGGGPVKGEYLKVFVSTTGTTNAATVTSFQLGGNSRPYPAGSADIRTFASNTPIGFSAFTAGLAGTFDSLLGGVTPAAGNIPSAGAKYCCGLYNGAVNIVANTALVALTGVTITPQIFVPGIGLTQVGGVVTLASTATEFSLELPHYPLILSFGNTTGATKSCDFNVNGTGRSF